MAQFVYDLARFGRDGWKTDRGERLCNQPPNMASIAKGTTVTLPSLDGDGSGGPQLGAVWVDKGVGGVNVPPLQMLAHLAELGTPPDDGAAVLRVSAGLRNSLERIERETLPFIAAGGGELQFVYGPYGRGEDALPQGAGPMGERARLRHRLRGTARGRSSPWSRPTVKLQPE